jgi:hypothetical protein
MKKILFLLFCFVISFAINAQEITSPDRNIKVVLSTQKILDNKPAGPIYFIILYKKGTEYIEVLPNSPLGIIRIE